MTWLWGRDVQKNNVFLADTGLYWGSNLFFLLSSGLRHGDHGHDGWEGAGVVGGAWHELPFSSATVPSGHMVRVPRHLAPQALSKAELLVE